VDRDHDVTLVAPSCTPLILDEEVLVTIGVRFTPTDGENTVIESSTATCRKDSRLVGLESSGASGDTDRNWTFLEGFLNWAWIDFSIRRFSYLNSSIRRDSTSSTAVSCAGSFSHLVWIISRSLKRCRLNIVESLFHITTLATISSSIAINNLLFGVINWGRVVGNGNSGRDSSGSGESPAGSTLSLVLDCGNFTFGNPVDHVRLIGGV
jgi:hypothetical protein